MKHFLAITLIITILLSGMGIFTWGHGRTTHAAPLLTTWYVNAATGNNGNDCLTPATACLTIAEAVSRAAHGDTIQIAAGVYDETLDISLELTLIGAGTENTFLDGGNSHRVLTASSNNLTLVDLTIQNGRTTNQNGGGIYNFGTLTLQNTRVLSNTAVNGGGAAIFNASDLTVQDSEISGNTADSVGGGIYGWTNTAVTVTHSLIAHNEGNQGGGIYSLGTAVLSNSTIQDNFAPAFGGGLTMFNGSMTLDRVTVSGNQSDGYGGGVLNNWGALTITNSTISGNTAPNYAGLANISSLAQTAVLNSTIAHNPTTGSGTRYGVANLDSAVISFQNTIIADHPSRNCVNTGSWTSLGHNLSDDSYCSFTSTGDLQNTPASLAPLGDYGGPTETHALLPGSAAIDSGDNAPCPTTDQRGIPRPFDGDGDGTAVCDRGAFEARNQLTISDVAVLEGDSGTVTAVFTVALSPTSTQQVTVDYETVDGTAVGTSDYVPDNDTLTFAPGQATQTIAILVNGDTADEPDETFTVHLSNPTNADVLDGQGTATIIDDDGLPSLTIADVTITEGNSGTTTATFTVSLSPADNNPVTVDFDTVNGTAVANGDYTAASGALTFAPGETSQPIAITIHGDQIDEGESETFTVQLSNPVNANLVDDEAAGVIEDDDISRVSVFNGPPVLEGDAGEAMAVFTVTLELPTAFPVTIDYYTQSGTGGNFATPGVDFAPISGTLTFNPGETEKTASVTIYSDLEEEEDEVFSLYLINANPISIYGSTAMATILNDDGDSWSVYLPIVIRP
ncbi:MAG: hypothetical protein HND44_04905 [Chloroflexi bacterium]|nr:hypothetical protein [Ardenticatenaceae bacterium]MBL1127834.1 hypothetical protein [Chloroflexota bacterium]NOG33903.1 hypothetical protein [Chloroflexota bacterium]GIK54765.1 MAG: hypothetical protein BroJett015_04280 [Chloroflexota bacterium]